MAGERRIAALCSLDVDRGSTTSPEKATLLKSWGQCPCSKMTNMGDKDYASEQDQADVA
jgi:hypothetical protein